MGKEVTGEYILVDGIKTHIFRTGQGKQLLLVHGLGAPQMWQRVLQPLAEAFDVIAIDLPGFGESDCPSEPYPTERYAEFLDHLFSVMNVQKANVVGISYGGQIAATLASRFPERVKNLVLIAATGAQQPRWFASNTMLWMPLSIILKYVVLQNRMMLGVLSRRSYYDLRNRPENLVENFRKQLVDPQKRNVWLNALRCALAPEEDFRESLTTLHHRVLIVWGAKDTSIHVRYAYEYQKLIPQAQVQIIPECAHSVPWERPEELCKAIKDFISL